ncbi:uncharacterized protein DFL_007779 [Arthrobotrys flagrans]|uniref:Uncharacterized protein n=1 Tax=Arthrobotrys flagrans TaxID=97331 RepID=A0A436ZX25_ARTFL|nr:hypothetical protein DFL_007779 [Arthrobotrys flagrans]
MFIRKIQKLFSRGGKEKNNKKKEQKGEHVYGNRMMLVAPITVGIAFPEMSPLEISPERPISPRPAVHSSHSVAAYGQEDLASIDGIPRPAFPRSLSTNMIDEERSQIDRHLRYETLDRRGLRLTTIVVGPKRLRALEEWEDLEQRAQEEAGNSLPVLPVMNKRGEAGAETGREFGDCKITVPAKPTPVRDEEPCDRRQGRKSIHRRMAMETGLRLRRWVDSKVGSITRPTRGPIARGFPFWLRDGVDPTVDTSSPHLYGRDRPGPKRTVHPRPWGTVLVTSATPPRTVPREFYREFARAAWYHFPNGFKDNEEEYAAYQQWMDA